MSQVARRAAMTAVVLVGACSSGPLAPLAQQRYALTSLNGAPLPVTVAVAPRTAVTLIADTLWFHAGDTYSRVIVFEYADSAGGDFETNRDSLSGPVSRIGTRLALNFECNDVIIFSICVPPDTARRAGSDLIVRSFLTLPGEKRFTRN